MARRKAGDGAGRPVPSALPPEAQREACREAALRLLGARARATAELRSRLRQKGFPAGVVEEVLSRLVETGLLDDRAFAARYAEGAAARGYAARRIQGELRRRGLDKEAAAEAATVGPEAETARAIATARARAARMGGLSDEVRARRLAAFLARRGFDPETCRIAVEAAVGSGVAEGVP